MVEGLFACLLVSMPDLQAPLDFSLLLCLEVGLRWVPLTSPGVHGLTAHTD